MAPKLKSPKALVSKKKRRYVDAANGFDLDLSYIGGDTTSTSTSSGDVIRGPLRDETGRGRIIAMGLPAEGVATLWRNPLEEVRRCLETNHPNNYAVYNLCSEPAYQQSLSGFGNDLAARVHHYGFDDRTPPPFAMIAPFCESVGGWLKRDGSNVAAVHCRAGKGRTGMMVSCYLLHSRGCRTAEEALRTFGTDRTKNGKGVTIPSQMRYVAYYQRALEGFDITPKAYRIERVRLTGGTPDFAPRAAGGGCDPFLRISEARLEEGTMTVTKDMMYDQRKFAKGALRHYGKSKGGVVEVDCSTHDVVVKGDVRVSVYHQDVAWPKSKKREMCRVWFHTGFVIADGDESKGDDCRVLTFGKAEIDRACKDKKGNIFDPSFAIEIVLREVNAVPAT